MYIWGGEALDGLRKRWGSLLYNVKKPIQEISKSLVCCYTVLGGVVSFANSPLASCLVEIANITS